MMEAWIVFSAGTFMTISGAILFVLNNRQERRMVKYLTETRNCNQDFEEAVALLRYGAVDEAVEVAQRWKERLDYQDQKEPHDQA